MSSPEAGAEMMTFFAPAARCLAASSRLVKKPVDDVDAEVAPGQVRRVAVGEDLERLAVDDQLAVADLDRARVRAEDRVVLEQLAERLGVRQVVDGDPLDVGVARVGGAEQVAADAAEAVDPDTYGHGRVQSFLRGGDFDLGDGGPYRSATGQCPPATTSTRRPSGSSTYAA
jgi:hypothetical protein